MDIFFTNLNEVPVPPDEVRIRDLRAVSWEDGRRVGVTVELDPFQKRPCLDLVVVNPEDDVVLFSTSVIESMSRKIEITIHLPKQEYMLPLTLSAILYYLKNPDEDLEGSDRINLYIPPEEIDSKSINFIP